MLINIPQITRKFKVIINVHNKILHLLILLLSELFSKLSEKLSLTCIIVYLNSFMLVYTVIIVFMMLYDNAYIFPLD